MPGPNTVLICFDGTWCTADSGSNVHRIFQHAKADDRQAKYYVDGLGTDGWKDSLAGGIWGIGIEKKIWKAYQHLQTSLVKTEDQLVIVGFSRGAFTACVFAVFLVTVGLHRKLKKEQFDAIFDAWRTKSEEGKDNASIYQDTGLDGSRFRTIKTHALGLFDTVAALDSKRPRFLSAAERKKLAFVDEGVLHAADHIFQALALLERRRDFEPCVFHHMGSCRSLRQCWFAGCHADVGGDKSNKHPLHHFPLLWMMSMLRRSVSFSKIKLFQDLLHNLKPILRVYEGKTVNDKDQEWVDSYYAKHVYKLSGPRPRVDALASSMSTMSLGEPGPSSSSSTSAMPPSEPSSSSSSLKSRISRALRPPPSILTDLTRQKAERMTTDLSSLTSALTTIHWTVAMFDDWTRSSFKATHSPLAGYARRLRFTPPLPDGDGQPAPAGNMGSLEGTVWESASGAIFWEEPLAELEGDFMVQGYGKKYGNDEVELFFNDNAQAGMSPMEGGVTVFDDRHGAYRGVDGFEQGMVETGEAYPLVDNYVEQLDENFNPAVLEEEEPRAGQIYLPVSGKQIRLVNEAIRNAGLGDAPLTFEQKLRYLEGRGQKFRY